MYDPRVTILAVAHVIRAALATVVPSPDPSDDPSWRDRGAVSIEQVLWYAAAAVSVAIVAAIIWSQIRSTASTPVDQPSAP